MLVFSFSGLTTGLFMIRAFFHIGIVLRQKDVMEITMKNIETNLRTLSWILGKVDIKNNYYNTLASNDELGSSKTLQIFGFSFIHQVMVP